MCFGEADYLAAESETRRESSTGRCSPSAALDEDAILARIDTLERLLAEDRARKPKFRKPALQKRWQEEIAALWRRLE